MRGGEVKMRKRSGRKKGRSREEGGGGGVASDEELASEGVESSFEGSTTRFLYTPTRRVGIYTHFWGDDKERTREGIEGREGRG